jgi:hypothetical protein
MELTPWSSAAFGGNRVRDMTLCCRNPFFRSSDIKESEPAVLGILADMIDTRLMRRFQKRPPEVGDDFSWLDDLIGWTESVHDVDV